MFANQFQFRFWCGLSQKIINSGLSSDRCGGQWVVAGDHDRLDPHPSQFAKAFLDSALDDVLQIDRPQCAFAIGNNQRSTTSFGDILDGTANFRWKLAAAFNHKVPDGICCPLANTTTIQIHTADASLGRERDERRLQLVDVSASQIVFVLCKHHDASPFRCFIRKRRQLCSIGQRGDINARGSD